MDTIAAPTSPRPSPPKQLPTWEEIRTNLEVGRFQLVSFGIELLTPLRIIMRRPGPFLCWVLVLFIFGTFGFWGPLFRAMSNVNSGDEALSNLYSAFGESILNRELLAFGIVILADGLGTLMSYMAAGMNNRSGDVRGIIGVFALFAFFLNTLIYSYTNTKLTISIVILHVAIFIFSSVMAILLYCLRTNDWERSVDELAEDDEREVLTLERQAKNARSTADGVSL